MVRLLTVREPSDHLRSLCHFWRAGDSYLFPRDTADPRLNCTDAQRAYPALFENPQCRYVLGVLGADELRVTWARLSPSLRRTWLADALAGTHAVIPLDRLSDGLLLLAHSFGHETPPPLSLTLSMRETQLETPAPCPTTSPSTPRTVIPSSTPSLAPSSTLAFARSSPRPGETLGTLVPFAVPVLVQPPRNVLVLVYSTRQVGPSDVEREKERERERC